MKTKKRRVDPLPERTYARSPMDFFNRIKQPLEELRTLLKMMDEIQLKELESLLNQEHLLVALPSICYAIPFPFLCFNSVRREEGNYLDWIWVDPKKNDPDRLTLVASPEAVSFVYMGLRLTDLDEIGDNQLHICLKQWAPKGIITTCYPEPMDCLEAFKLYWERDKPAIDNFIARLNLALGFAQQQMLVHEAVNWP